MYLLPFFFTLLLSTFSLAAEAKIELGIDRLFSDPYAKLLQGKKIGLITNQTGVNRSLETTMQLFIQHQKRYGYELKAFFAPEHGIFGESYAEESIATIKSVGGIPIYSLHGETRRPTKEMLKAISLLVFDIQDIGSRTYTFASTLFYVMEEAAKQHIPVLVLDRPNPINGIVIDGPMLEKEFRSFIGYVNVPYCHGMTIGELARLFNEQYAIKCDLHIVPMKGWKRSMSFEETGLTWIPTSPNIPEASTVCFYPITGPVGEIAPVSIGIGYTLPFKVIGAPWIQADLFASALNQYQLPGVIFHPTRFKPFAGRFAKKSCQGVLITITDRQRFLPVTTQYAILSALKALYPKQMNEGIKAFEEKQNNFFKSCGTQEIFKILKTKKTAFEELKTIHSKERAEFLVTRKKFILSDYQ
ncbi:MAG: DUF1343 domain-containing protein [Verrucomicrobia bacterium]|nr:DUF1343 domain-containing protein [Verrucomicrobiota bacterium]